MRQTEGPSTESGAATGRDGEEQVIRYLRRIGYRIIDRNFRCSYGEIDIVAREGATLVFVEVRTRSSAAWGSALETVGSIKQARLSRAAAVYLAKHDHLTFDDCRFDVVGITEGEIVHAESAFLPLSAFSA